MSTEILRCPKCKTYSALEKCKDCGSKTLSPKPAKYSPEDPYGKYRRMAKKDEKEKKKETTEDH